MKLLALKITAVGAFFAALSTLAAMPTTKPAHCGFNSVTKIITIPAAIEFRHAALQPALEDTWPIESRFVSLEPSDSTPAPASSRDVESKLEDEPEAEVKPRRVFRYRYRPYMRMRFSRR